METKRAAAAGWRFFLLSVVLAGLIPGVFTPSPAAAAPQWLSALCALLPPGVTQGEGGYMDGALDFCSGSFNSAAYSVGITIGLFTSEAAAENELKVGNYPACSQNLGDQCIDLGNLGSGEMIYFKYGCYVVIGSDSATDQSDVGKLTPYLQGTLQNLQKIPRCPAGQPAQPTQPAQPAQPTQPANPIPATAASGPFSIAGMACSGTPAETGALGRVVCNPITSNESGPASISYAIDGQPVGSRRTLSVDGVAPGLHTVTVTGDLNGARSIFSMLITVYADQTPPNYTLLVNCLPDGSQAKRTLTCSASPDNGSPAGSLGYNWFAGGAPVGGCSGATCTISGVGFGQTQVQVQAKDSSTGKSSGLATSVIPPAPGAPAPVAQDNQVQVQAPSGSVVLGPGQQTSLDLKKGEKASVTAICNKLVSYFRLMELAFDQNEVSSDASLAYLHDQLLFMISQLNCKDFKSYAPSGTLPGLAAIGLPALASARLAAPSTAPVQAELTLSQGYVRVTPQLDLLDLIFQTPSAQVTSHGKADFAISYNPASGQTSLGSYSGTLTLQPRAAGAKPVTLYAGQKVAVDKSGAGQVQTFSAASTPLIGGDASGLLLGLCCCLGLIFLALGGLFLVFRRRKPKQAAPAIPPAPTRVPQGPGARLILVSGPASQTWLSLPAQGLLIGSHPACGLVIPGAGVSPYHARLDWGDGAWVLADMNTPAGTYLNGARIQRQFLRPGDQIKIGGTILGLQ